MSQKKGGVPIGDWPGANATNQLHKMIEEFNEPTKRQTNQMVVLTWIIAILTFLLFVGLIIQIWLAW
jgi:hypothetical protein